MSLRDRVPATPRAGLCGWLLAASPPSASPTSPCCAGGAATVRFTRSTCSTEIAPRRPRWRRHVVAGLQLLGPRRRRRRHRPADLDDDRAHRQRGPHPRCCSTCRCRWWPPTSRRTGSTPRSRRPATSSTRSPTTSRSALDLLQRRRRRRGAADARPRPRSTRRSTTSSSPRPRRSATPCRRHRPARPAAGETPTGDATSDEEQVAPGAIVLLSDGETTVGRPTEEGAAEAADGRRPGVHDRLRHARRGDRRSDSGETVAGPGAARAAAGRRRGDGRRGYEAATATELADAYERIQDVLGETLGEEIESRHRADVGLGRRRPRPPRRSPGPSACGGSAAWSEPSLAGSHAR